MATMFGSAFGRFPPSNDPMEIALNFLVRPMDQVLGVQKLAGKQLVAAVDQVLEQQLGGEAEPDLEKMFAQLREVYFRSVLDVCPVLYDLSPLEKIRKLGEERVKSMKFEKAMQFKKQLEQQTEQFTSSLEAAKKEINSFLCNCRNVYLKESVRTLAVYAINNIPKTLADPNDQKAIDLIMANVLFFTKLYLQIVPEVPQSDDIDSYSNYLNLASNLLLSAVSLGDAKGDDPGALRRVALSAVRTALKELQPRVPDFVMSSIVTSPFQGQIIRHYEDINYTFFYNPEMLQNARLDFSSQKILSQFQLASLGFIGNPENNEERMEEAQAVLASLDPAPMVDQLPEMYDFDEGINPFLTNYATLLGNLFYFDELQEASDAAVRVFAEFLEEVRQNDEEMIKGPEQFDKFLDRSADKDYLRGFYHLVKLWNLISFANLDQIDYVFQWKPQQRSASIETNPNYELIDMAFEKIESSIPKNAAKREANALILYQLYEVQKDTKEFVDNTIEIKEETAVGYEAQTQGLKIGINVEKRGTRFELVDCKQAKPKEEKSPEDRYVITVKGQSRTTDKAGFLEAVEDCKKPKFKIIKHFFLPNSKNCQPTTEELMVFDEPAADKAHEYFFLGQNNARTPTTKAEFDQAVEDCLHPPTYVVRTHTVDGCDIATTEVVHNGRPKPTQALDIYQEITTGDNNEVVETKSLTKEQFLSIKKDCDEPRLVYSTKTTFDDEDCHVLDEQKTPYKRVLPRGVRPFYYFLKTEQETSELTPEQFSKWKEECDHPVELHSNIRTVNDDDCSFKTRIEVFHRRLPKGITEKRYVKVYTDKQTKELKEDFITLEEYNKLEESCLNPVEIKTFAHTVKNVCDFEVTQTVYKRRLPDGVETESFFELTDEAEPKKLKLTEQQFKKIQKDCDEKVVVATETTINDENCDTHVETKEFKRKLPFNVLPQAYFVLYSQGGDLQKKSVTFEQFQAVDLDCKNPQTLEVTHYTIDKDCGYKVTKEKFQRRLPRGIETEMYYTEETGSAQRVTKSEYDAFDSKCDQRVFITKVYTIDEESCQPIVLDVEHHRSLPKDIPPATYNRISTTAEGEKVQTAIDQETYEKIKYDCDHPKTLTSTTFIANDDDCLFDVRMKMFERKLPKDVEPEYWAVIINQVERPSNKEEYDRIKDSCDRPPTVYSHRHFIDDDNCHEKTIDEPHRRRLPKDVAEHSFFVTSHDNIVFDTEADFKRVKQGCDDPITVIAQQHFINDDNCDKKTEEIPYKRRLPANVEKDSYFVTRGTATESASFEQFEKVRKSCDEPITVFSHEHFINDDNCEKDEKDVPHLRRLPKDVAEHSYFVTQGRTTRPASPEQYEQVKKSCDDPIKIKVVNHIVVNCEFLTESQEYSRRLPLNIEEVNYYSEELDGTREKITDQKFVEIKAKCERAKPITMLDTFKKTSDLFVLDRCKVTFHVPTGRLGPDGKREQQPVTFIIIKGEKIHQVEKQEFELAQRQCSFHGAVDDDVYPDTSRLPQFSVAKHVLTEDCEDEPSEEKFVGPKPEDFQPETWFVRVSGSEHQLSSQAQFEEEKTKCQAAKPQHKIPEPPRQRNEVEMIRGAIPEKDLDDMRNAPEFVDHLNGLRNLVELDDPDKLSDAELKDYLRQNPLVYDPATDQYIRVTFVQVARQGSDCLKQFEL